MLTSRKIKNNTCFREVLSRPFINHPSASFYTSFFKNRPWSRLQEKKKDIEQL